MIYEINIKDSTLNVTKKFKMGIIETKQVVGSFKTFNEATKAIAEDKRK